MENVGRKKNYQESEIFDENVFADELLVEAKPLRIHQHQNKRSFNNFPSDIKNSKNR